MKTTRRDFILKGGAAMALGLLPFNARSIDHLAAPIASGSFQRMTPESQGISSAAISKFVKAANDSGLQWHSFMLLRHGNVIAEGWWKPFAPEYKHTLYSLSKSFTSTAIGLLVKDGKLKVDDPVISYFPEALPSEVSANLKRMTIKHLLTMNTGHGTDTTPAMRESTAPWTKTFLALPVEHAPGSHFLYNSGATYMLGAIVTKITGKDLESFLTPRLFDPLGIKDHDWEKSPEGLNVAGWGLRLKTEDIARLGQLYLQKGKWSGKEIITESWVKDASSAQTTSNPGDGDWSQGYGYQFWRCKPGFFRGDGAFGQYCIVMPEHDAVMVVNSESWDMQKQMVIIWENILPAMTSSALPEDKAEQKKLQDAITNLSIPVVKSSTSSTSLKRYHGKKFSFQKNEFDILEIGLNFTGNDCSITVNTSNGKQTIQAGWENWMISKASEPYVFSIPNRNPVPSKTAATATWINDTTLQINVRFVEAIHGDKLTFTFVNNDLSITMLNSVSENNNNNPEKRQVLKGAIV